MAVALVVAACAGTAPSGASETSRSIPFTQAPCTNGAPVDAYRGYCATFSGANTYFGLYGPGFPTPAGWGLCASAAALGGGYPSPGYGYVPSGSPAGIDSAQLGAFGYALSSAQASGWIVAGRRGRYTADQLGAAIKLVYDHLAWGAPYPAADAGTARAIDDLRVVTAGVAGITAAPTIAVAIVERGSPGRETTAVVVTVAVPGSGRGLAGVVVSVHLRGATVAGSGAAAASMTTAGGGTGSIPIRLVGTAASTATATVSAVVGAPGLAFWSPTSIVPSAQTIAAPAPATVVSGTAVVAVTGSIQIAKSGDDPAWPVTGATFQLVNDVGAVVDTLVVGSGGITPVSVPLAVGSYSVRESVAPPGYGVAPDQTVVVVANATTLVSFTGTHGDLIRRSSLAVRKVDALSGAPLAGAALALVDQSGTIVAACTTPEDGTCDFSDLLPGTYELTEVSPPVGFATAAGLPQSVTLAPGQTTTVVVADPPLVSVTVRKAAAGSPNSGAQGAIFDLYRMDHGSLPAPPAPSDSRALAGGTWIARGTTSVGGLLEFQALLPGWAYCAIEHTAPANFTVDPAPVCTTVLGGTTELLAGEISVVDARERATLSVFKFNAAQPGVGIPGAVFDVYSKGAAAPGASAQPAGVPTFSGLSYFVSGTTGADGRLAFNVPAGYAWCIHESSVPEGWIIDPSLTCTSGTLTSSDAGGMIALPETASSAMLHVYKFNATAPDEGIAGAGFGLFVVGSLPSGYVAPPVLAGVAVPRGTTFWATGTTDAAGRLSFGVPSGHAWCIRELYAPPGYVLDAAVLCTGVLTTSTSVAASTIAVPEALAMTGGPSPWPAVVLIGTGLALLAISRRRRAPSVP